MKYSSNSQNRRLRVVILARSLEVGGAETQLVALASGLPADRYDVTVACLYAKGPLISVLRDANIDIVPLEKRGRWDVFGFLYRAAKTLKALKPDVLHSFLTPPNILSALLRHQLGSCKLVWGLRASDMNLMHYDWTWTATFWLERLLSRIPDKIVANAEKGQRYAVQKGFFSKRFSVIHNGIDTKKFEFDTKAAQDIREEFGISSDAFVIGIAARLDPIKDFGTFFKAAAMLATKFPKVRFLCVGAGTAENEASIKKLASTEGIGNLVVWTGLRDDMPAIYSGLNVATLTSTSEGFPNTLAEAMSCSVPCVATDVGDTAILVGDTGYVVPVGDANEIVNGWSRLLTENDVAKAVRGKKCSQRIANNFSLKSMIENHSELYEQLCRTPTKASIKQTSL
jgi:glycosyltransferase involved in cell wall biosynthesis